MAISLLIIIMPIQNRGELGLRGWFSNILELKEKDIYNTLHNEYEQSCVQMRHWDNIQWVLNGFFFGIGLGIISYSLKSPYEILEKQILNIVVAFIGISFLWCWFLFVYSSFRKRALRTFTFILLIEYLLNLNSQTYPVLDSHYIKPARKYKTFINLRSFMFAFLAVISLLVIAYFLYSYFLTKYNSGIIFNWF